MRVLYHITSSLPRIPGTDALYQEVHHLCNSFEGKIIRWYPFHNYTKFFLPLFYGFHQILTIKRAEADYDLHHIFNPNWYHFPILRILKKPVVYSISGGFNPDLLPGPVQNMYLVLQSNQEKLLAEQRGWKTVSVITAGIDTSRFQVVPKPVINHEFVLLAGSAPWISEQFERKGFDLLLKVMQRDASIRLICLWRGYLYDEWMMRIASAGLSERVEVYNEYINLPTIMNEIHASIVMADHSDIVKAWPHSLLESIASGRPIILNNKIKLSDFVKSTGCGVVLEDMEINELEIAIKKLRERYEQYQKAAEGAKYQLSCSKEVQEYRSLYSKIIKSGNLR